MIRLLTVASPLLAAAILLTPLTGLQAQQYVVPDDTSDVFDVSQGARVISHTPLHSTSDVRNMFGHLYNSTYAHEINSTLFDDRQPQGTVHSVEWVTATPVALHRIELKLSHDLAGGRAISQFRFYAQRPNGTFALIDTHDLAPPYGEGSQGTQLRYQKDLDLTSGRFRAEFVQHSHPDLSSGPRVVELNGFGQSLPNPPPPRSDDLFDISQGTTITSHSPLFSRQGQADARDLFGGDFTQINGFPELTGHLLFQDGLPEGTEHVVEWQTANPVTLESFRLYASHDAVAPADPTEARDANQRGFRRFTLSAKDDSGTWQTVYEYVPANPYGQGEDELFNELAIERSVSAPTTRVFRAEFEQYGPGHPLHSAPHVIELDGFGQVEEVDQPPAVLFVPGLKASRLYTEGAIGENRLWEPNTNADGEKLFLNEQGQSSDLNIYTRDVIDEAFTINIYKTFLAFLDEQRTNGTIADWTTVPYDWRLPNRTHAPTITAALRDLVASNPGRPVTIITHSNGALVAKAALARLIDQNDSLLNRINRVMYVAAPHHGTPSAAAALLHGYDQQLLGGLLLHQSTARELAEHMVSAFELLPTDNYFAAVDDPVVSFDDSLANLELFNDPEDVTSSESLRAFVTGTIGDREEPVPDDTITPNLLSSDLLDQAVAARQTYNQLQLPDHIDTVNIVGWGLDTVKGLEYYAKREYGCQDSHQPTCQNGYTLDIRPHFTIEGDNTVVQASTGAADEKEYFVNLDDYNEIPFNISRDHKNILEIPQIQQFLANTFRDIEELPEFITTDKPEPASTNSRLRVSAHSPVTLTLTDNQGRRVGRLPNTDSQVRQIVEDLPSSYYLELGEGKYAGASLLDPRTIKLEGTGLGTFTLKVREVQADRVVEETIFSDIPVTDRTQAHLEVIPTGDDKVLQLDWDGDGQVDNTVSTTDQDYAMEIGLGALQKAIAGLDIKHGVKTSLQARLSATQRLLDRGPRQHQAGQNLLNVIDRAIQRFQSRGHLDSDTAQGLRVILSTITRNTN